MTTIAFDGKLLVADTLVNCEGARFGYISKIHIVPDIGVVAIAGNLDGTDTFLDYLQTGKLPDQDFKNLSALVISYTGKVYEYAMLHRFETCVPWCGGSGIWFAKSAMHLGMTAVQAVSHAIDLDVYSGGAIEYVRLDEILAGKPVKRVYENVNINDFVPIT